MDEYNIDPKGAVPQLKKTQTEDTPRPPLGPSEKNNVVPVARKLRTREIASRYKSEISSTANSNVVVPRRCPSPNAGRTSSSLEALLPHRAQSAERRRPSTPSSRSSLPSSPSSRSATPTSPSLRSTTPVRDSVTEMHRSSKRLLAGRTPDGLWPSMRSLASSFQSNTISIPVLKEDSLNDASKSSAKAVTQRKRTPLRGRNSCDQSENSKLVDNSHMVTVDRNSSSGLMGGKVASSSYSRDTDLAEKVSRSASLPIPSRGGSPRRMLLSGGLQKSTSEVARKVPVDVVGRGARDMDNGLTASSHLPEIAWSATCVTKSQPSPAQGLHRFQSPSRTSSRPSSSRGTHSPSRTRTSTSLSSSSNIASRATTPSVLNYIVDVRKGKKSASHIDDTHQLRLLYNRHLQWRFVNARAEDALSIQQIKTENTLQNVWVTTSELCNAVILNRTKVQHLNEDMKLYQILNEQIPYLEEWAVLDGEHCDSVSGAIEALKASTLRLPVTGGARADVHAVRNAVSSAVDVMQAMGSSICNLLSKGEGTKALIVELSAVAAKEKALLDECQEMLASTAAMQMQESSLRTHLLQLRDGSRKAV